MEQQKQDRFTKQQKLMVLMMVTCFVMMIVVITLGWYVFDYSSNKIQKNNETISALLKNPNLENSGKVLDAEKIDYANLKAEDVIKMVSRHILLADGEVTVATVINIDGLRTDYPELFTYAKIGDKLIFYSLGIIIYDPVLDRVVDVIRRLPADIVIPQSVNETK